MLAQNAGSKPAEPSRPTGAIPKTSKSGASLAREQESIFVNLPFGRKTFRTKFHIFRTKFHIFRTKFHIFHTKFHIFGQNFTLFGKNFTFFGQNFTFFGQSSIHKQLKNKCVCALRTIISDCIWRRKRSCLHSLMLPSYDLSVNYTRNCF
jgi:hypothetical protein